MGRAPFRTHARPSRGRAPVLGPQVLLEPCRDAVVDALGAGAVAGLSGDDDVGERAVVPLARQAPQALLGEGEPHHPARGANERQVTVVVAAPVAQALPLGPVCHERHDYEVDVVGRNDRKVPEGGVIGAKGTGRPVEEGRVEPAPGAPVNQAHAHRERPVRALEAWHRHRHAVLERMGHEHGGVRLGANRAVRRNDRTRPVATGDGVSQPAEAPAGELAATRPLARVQGVARRERL